MGTDTGHGFDISVNTSSEERRLAHHQVCSVLRGVRGVSHDTCVQCCDLDLGFWME